MERLPGWVDSVCVTHGFSENLKFSIRLCLEEVVSNVIRHGYGNDTEQLVTVRCDASRPDRPVFTIDDNAAAFNPLEMAPLPAINQQNEMELGGQGIRLLRGFAETLEYEARPSGNRLRIGFSDAG
jgi:anti-sigma regulatory factor (Ser/Thr protein kinase)